MQFRGLQIRVLRRAHQRSIRLSVKPSGEVLLSTSRATPQRMMESFLAQAWPWLEKQVLKAESFRQRYPPKQFAPGEYVLFLGRQRQLKLLPSQGLRWRIEVRENEMLVCGPRTPSAKSNLGALIRKFYEAQARKILASRVQQYSQQMGLLPKRLSFRCQKSRWGSCSASGAISLNWRLIAAPLDVIDYVVVHELAHLKVPNHSEAFWRLVGAHFPEHRVAQKWLREHHMELDFLLPGL